jgi:hypothetical protein
MYDRLTLEAEAKYFPFAVSPTILLTLIEGILGYRNVAVDAGAGTWHYRKDTEFKKS